MSSPLVTFSFKTFPKHRQTQFWIFMAHLWEMCRWRQLVSIDFDKKIRKNRLSQFFFKGKVLTLIRLTSERPCQDRGGAPGAPPIYLGSGANFCSKIMFPQKLASIPTHLAPFQNIFSKNHKKIGENWKSIKKLLKMSENSKICNFWAISTCNTSKESIFHIEFNFT